MSKFKKGEEKGTPAISTASLPDIVFMLLFFFMVTTVMREETLKVENHLPEATEVKKMEKKSLVSYIYIGSANDYEKKSRNRGSETLVQLDGVLYTQEEVSNEIPVFIAKQQESKDEDEIPYMTTSIKADENVTMGIVTDIKNALRRVEAYKINYSTVKKSKNDNKR